MAKTSIGEYNVDCQHCLKETTFRVCDVPQLEEDIESDEDAVCDEAAATARREFDGWIDPDDLDRRIAFEIGAAIRRKNLDEVTEKLRELCDVLGGYLQEEFDRGLITTIPLFEGRRAA